MWVATLWLLLAATLVSSLRDGLDFVGIGYNLLEGNPDGDILQRGGIDPGLLTTRKIFHLSSDGHDVVYERRHSCASIQKTELFYGTKSYQDKLAVGVDISGSVNAGLAGVKFGLSPGYQNVKEETNRDRTFYRDSITICNLGRARYATELATSGSLSVDRNFAAAMCQLPTFYNEKKYMDFFDAWGTHIVSEVDLGTKEIHRYKSSYSQLVEHLMKDKHLGVSLGGSYMGYGASLGVNFDKLKSSTTSTTHIGSYQYTLNAGTNSLPEPISITVKSIDFAANKLFWGSIASYVSDGLCSHDITSTLPKIKINLAFALGDYGTYKRLHPSEDPSLKIPVTWPRGTYGLLEPHDGCPSDNDFQWSTGYRVQATEDRSPHTVASSSMHAKGWVHPSQVAQVFCTKGRSQVTQYDMDWPSGDYCVYKYGNCPSGFNTGFIYWDNEDGNTINKKHGVLPDGVYGDDTKMYFCCREDGLPTNPIVLPTDTPFYLLRNRRTCQEVTNAHLTEEWVSFDDEDGFMFWPTHDAEGGDHPYDDGQKSYHKIHYCYYTPTGTHSTGSVNHVIG